MRLTVLDIGSNPAPQVVVVPGDLPFNGIGTMWQENPADTVEALPPGDEGQVLTAHGVGSPLTWEDPSGGGGGSTPTIQEEGVSLAGSPHTTLNFVGAGVTAANAGGGVATITIPGNPTINDLMPFLGTGTTWYETAGAVTALAAGANGMVLTSHGAAAPTWETPASALATIRDEGNAVAGSPHTIINFVGGGVTVTDDGGGIATVTIPSWLSAESDTLQTVYDRGQSIDTSGDGPVLLSGLAGAYSLSLSHAALGTDFANRDSGLRLVNPTAATDGFVQASPSVVWRGNVFDAGAAASEWIDWAAYFVPESQSTSTRGQLRFATRREGGDFAERYADSGYGDASVVFTDHGGDSRVCAMGFGYLHEELGNGFYETYVGVGHASNKVTLSTTAPLEISGDALTVWLKDGGFYGDPTLGLSTSRWAKMWGTSVDLLQGADSAGVPDEMLYAQAGAHTSVNNAEVIDARLNLARTITWDGHATVTQTIATQRSFYIEAPTFNATLGGGDPEAGSGGVRFTKAGTLVVSGAPIDGGANVSIDNAYSIWSQSGTVRIENDAANAKDALSISKTPAGSQAGDGVDIAMGANATGRAISIVHSGTGADIKLSARTADPSTLGAGDLWFHDTSNVIKFYDGTTTQTLLRTGDVGLDEAYDKGGSGAGRSITADSGAIAATNNAASNAHVWEATKSPSGSQGGSGFRATMGANANAPAFRSDRASGATAGREAFYGVQDALGVASQQVGITLSNTTDAAGGAQQMTPDYVADGRGWKTNATAASQTVAYRHYGLPVQGAANPSLNIELETSINNGAFVRQLSVKSEGSVRYRNLTANPTTNLEEGDFWYRSDLNSFYFYDGSAAVAIGGGGLTFTEMADFATISTTEYSLPNDSTTLAAQTDDCQLQVFIDFDAMVAGDQYEIKIYEKVSAGTARFAHYAVVTGDQSELWVSPLLVVMDGWDVTVKRLAGSDRSIRWSLRKVT